MISFLLAGDALPAPRVLERRLAPATVAARDFPPWRFGERHLHLAALVGRVVVHVRSTALALADAVRGSAPASP